MFLVGLATRGPVALQQWMFPDVDSQVVKDSYLRLLQGGGQQESANKNTERPIKYAFKLSNE